MSADRTQRAIELFDRHADEVFRFCFRRLGNIHLAGHLTTEAFAIVLSRSAILRADAEALQDAARRLVDRHYLHVFQDRDWSDPADSRRVHTRRPFCWEEENSAAAGCRPGEPSRIHQLHELARHSSRLSEDERRCFLMKFFLNKTFDEIALEAGVPAGEVKDCIQRALKTLREELDTRGGTS